MVNYESDACFYGFEAQGWCGTLVPREVQLCAVWVAPVQGHLALTRVNQQAKGGRTCCGGAARVDG